MYMYLNVLVLIYDIIFYDIICIVIMLFVFYLCGVVSFVYGFVGY